jgi:hypothetical protein
LLLDVIHAACGIEYTVERLLAAIDEVQRWLDDTWQDLEPGEIAVSAERWDVSFEVSNLVVWGAHASGAMRGLAFIGGRWRDGVLYARLRGDMTGPGD